MRAPDWWEFALLAVAAWRVFQLVAFDDILNRPRRKLLRLARDWEEGDDVPEEYRLKWARFITCPFCAGAWIATAWWIAWQANHKWTLIVASLVALWALPVAGHKLLAKEEDK